MKYITTCCAFFPKRYLLVLMAFLGFVVTYHVQLSLTVTINEIIKNPLNGSLCLGPYKYTINRTKQFDWSDSTQSTILAGSQIGLLLGHSPAGVLVDVYGGKHFLTVTFFMRSLESALIPPAAKTGPPWLILVRVISGLSQSFCMPGFNEMIARWVTKEEQTGLFGFVITGVYAGITTGTLLAGYILHSLEWEWVFYIFGIEAFFFAIAWMLLTSSRPDEHRFITNEEKEFLENNIPPKKKKLKAPLKLIFTNLPVWSFFLGNIGVSCATVTLYTEFPKYMTHILGISAPDYPLLLALPTVMLWWSSAIIGLVFNVIIKRKTVALVTVRRFGAIMGTLGVLLLYFATTHVECNQAAALTILSIGSLLLGFYIPSIRVSAVDLSPNYAGSLSGIATTFFGLAAVGSIHLVGIMTAERSFISWTYALMVLGIIIIVTVLPYIFFISGDVQPFNDVYVTTT